MLALLSPLRDTAVGGSRSSLRRPSSLPPPPAAATGMRQLALTDNAGGVGDAWLAGLAAARQLSHLDLNSCKLLSPAALEPLLQLTALTSLKAYR